MENMKKFYIHFSKIVEKYSDSVLVLAPRHIDKIAKLEESANQFGIPYFKRTNFRVKKLMLKQVEDL